MNKYNCEIEYTEHVGSRTKTVVYARTPEDAAAIARLEFFDRRRDTPTIDQVTVNQVTSKVGDLAALARKD